MNRAAYAQITDTCINVLCGRECIWRLVMLRVFAVVWFLGGSMLASMHFTLAHGRAACVCCVYLNASRRVLCFVAETVETCATSAHQARPHTLDSLSLCGPF